MYIVTRGYSLSGLLFFVSVGRPLSLTFTVYTSSYSTCGREGGRGSAPSSPLPAPACHLLLRLQIVQLGWVYLSRVTYLKVVCSILWLCALCELKSLYIIVEKNSIILGRIQHNMTQYSIYLFGVLLKTQTCWRNKDKNLKSKHPEKFDCGLYIYGHLKLSMYTTLYWETDCAPKVKVFGKVLRGKCMLFCSPI